MAEDGVPRRASPWGEPEVTLLLKVLYRNDYWLSKLHAHPMEHKRAVLQKVRRVMRSRFGVERSREQIRRKIADLRYKCPQRIENIRRQIRNQRAAAARVPPQSSSEELAPSPSTSDQPQQATPGPSTPPAGGATSENIGCADQEQRVTSPIVRTPSPASSSAIGSPHVQHGLDLGPHHDEPIFSSQFSPERVGPPLRSIKDTIDRMLEQQAVLEREVRLHGELLTLLRAQLF